jgi:Fe2+ transport system protein FeoA
MSVEIAVDHALRNNAAKDHASEDTAHADSAAVGDAPTDDAKGFPLALARSGERLRIATFKTGKGLCKRLGGLGLHKGSVVEVVLRQMNGSVVVSHDNNRVALGAGTAQMIIVTLCAQRTGE